MPKASVKKCCIGVCLWRIYVQAQHNVNSIFLKKGKSLKGLMTASGSIVYDYGINVPSSFTYNRYSKAAIGV